MSSIILGGFDYGIHNPNFRSRVEIIDYYTSRVNVEFVLSSKEMAKLTTGYNCAELETLVNECVYCADDEGVVSEEIIRRKYAEIINANIATADGVNRIDACTCVGCALAAREFGDFDYSLGSDVPYTGNVYFDKICAKLINEDDDDDDDDYDEEDEEIEDEDESYEPVGNYNKTEIINTVTVLIAGMVAEEVALGCSYDNIRRIFVAIDGLLLSCSAHGMLGINNVYRSDRHKYQINYPIEFVDRINEIFDTIKETCYNKAKDILSGKAELINILSDALVCKGHLSKQETEEIIEDYYA